MFKWRLRCSFCGKSAAQVSKLVAGRRGYICDVCAAEAHRIMSEWDPTAPPAPQPKSLGARIKRLLSRLSHASTRTLLLHRPA
jgi:ATP-dependent Clp protease ATP-binding subunit ClpX